MAAETERKFLVQNEAWRGSVISCATLRQGYLAIDDGNTVRVRTDGDKAWLTVKGPAVGCTRPEFEYAVPVPDAESMMALCRERVIEKVRHRVPSADGIWEIDEFLGKNAGLVLAEIEFDQPAQEIHIPSWVGDEVTSDLRYSNANLSLRPWKTWASSASI